MLPQFMWKSNSVTGLRNHFLMTVSMVAGLVIFAPTANSMYRMPESIAGSAAKEFTEVRTMNNKLKPCPFCDGDDVFIRVHCNEEGE